MAATAMQRQWCIPDIPDPKLNDAQDLSFDVEDGWHPIQKSFLCNDQQFIHNDIKFDHVFDSNKCENGRIQILTGPNQSGKSVYLKQCGIICYLAHIGSYVPAKKCSLTITDKILTRIHCTDDINSSLSTYSRDCCQMSYLLRNATKNSLCLIDEFGKGTWNHDGIALMTSIINHYNKTIPPKILIATHFHELFQYDLIKETNYIRFYFMDIITSAMNNHDDDEKKQDLTFLYKVKPGKCTKSFGIECAKSAGICVDVQNRTKEIMNAIQNKLPIEPMKDSNHDEIIKTGNEIKAILLSGNDWKRGDLFTKLIELVQHWGESNHQQEQSSNHP